MALGLASMIVGVASFRTQKTYQLPLKTFAAFKDATIAYFIAGLVIAPEVYNPLIGWFIYWLGIFDVKYNWFVICVIVIQSRILPQVNQALKDK